MDKIITVSACGMEKRQVLAIGRQMENNYRQIVFDCSGFDVEVSSVTLVHLRSQDIAPYIVDSSSTDQLTWTVTNTDTAYAGYGKAELRITFTNGLAKSVVFTTMVIQSITADTTIPQPLQSWYDAMIDYIDEHSISPEELAQAIEDYLTEHPITAPVQSVNTMTGDVVITAADLGALTAELDPVFGASAAAGITSGDITAWNGKYTKPSGGVPVSDLNSTAQSRLMPTGGSTGQVLAKKSNSNYDLEWVNQSGGGGAVDSVNGQTGTVVLTASDVGALADTYTAPVSSVNTKTGAVSLTASDVGALPSTTTYVSSFNGSTGAVTYTAPVTSVNGQTGAVSVLPSGGSSGQVLSKASGTDYDVEWTTAQGGGGNDWTILHDSTTTEAGNLSIAITNISIKEVKVYAIAPAGYQSTVVIYCPLNNNEGNHYDKGYGRPMVGLSNAGGSRKFFYVNQLPVIIDGVTENETYSANDGNQGAIQVKVGTATHVTAGMTFTSMSVATYVAIPAGLRIVVLGR